MVQQVEKLAETEAVFQILFQVCTLVMTNYKDAFTYAAFGLFEWKPGVFSSLDVVHMCGCEHSNRAQVWTKTISLTARWSQWGGRVLVPVEL